MSFDMRIRDFGNTTETWYGDSVRSFEEWFQGMPDGSWVLVQTDAHDALSASIVYRSAGETVWCELRLEPTLIEEDAFARQVLAELAAQRTR